MTNGSEKAFASIIEHGGEVVIGEEGLTKREYFAAMAITTMSPNDFFDSYADDAGVVTTAAVYMATRAVQIADALIEALNKEQS